MKRFIVVWLCMILVFSSMVLSVGQEDVVEAKEVVGDGATYVPLTPFRINSNVDLPGIATSGDGSASSPWIIENYDIDGNFYSECIYIGNTTDHVIIRDCYLHDVDGIETWPYYNNAGITIYDSENVVVENNTMENNWNYGIYIYDSPPKVGNNLIKNNTIYDNPTGIMNTQSENNRIENNTIFNNRYYGIRTWFSVDNYISNNTITNYENMTGISIADSSYISCFGNNMTGCSFDIQAMQLYRWNTHEIDSTNMVNNKPVYYLKNQTSGTIPADAGQVLLGNCTNIIISNIDASNGSMGIELGFSSWNTIMGSVISNNTQSGCYLYTSKNNTFEGNVMQNNRYTGIFSRSSSDNNTISNNTFNESGKGIQVSSSIYNTFNNNDFSDCSYGLYLEWGGYHTVQDNNIFSNQRGLRSFGSDNNLIIDNIIEDNTNIGLEFVMATSNNNIYHNDIISNTIQASDDGTNNWNDSYPNGGNYWSNYSGIDIQSGVNQDQAGSDGFGDTPFIMDSDSQDNYPLMDQVYVDQYIPHLSIRINSNADFDPAHGVSNGSGTPGDPWIIEGWDIDGTGYGFCIYIGNTTENFIVRDCYLHDASGAITDPYSSDSGLYMYNVQNGNIENNTASLNYGVGIKLSESSNNNITNNNASLSNYNGIILLDSSNNTIANNSAYSNNFFGILLSGTITNIIANNTMVDNGIHMAGEQLEHWNTHKIDTSNTVNGKPVYYWKNQTGGTVPLGAGQVILANCTNVVVDNQNVSDGTCGIELGFSSNNTIANNIASSNNDPGIYLYSSSYNTITNNTALNNNYGICIYFYSNNNTIVNNNASLNYHRGIYLYSSSNNTITNNTVSNNWIGVLVLAPSSNNKIYHNNFFGNTAEEANDNSGLNQWDNGYPSGGNYWSDYTGVDLNSTPTQDTPPSDGIGDTPYTNIGGGAGALDNYPLMHEFWVDEAPPAIELISPVNNTFINAGDLIQFDIWDGNLDLKTVNYSINGGSDQTFSVNYEIDTSLWADGDYSIEVKADDDAGNTALELFKFMIDTSPPSIALNSPANNSFIIAGVIIDLSILDDNIDIVNYSINGALAQNFIINYEINTTGWGNGTYSIVIHATDANGNMASNVFNFILDPTPPDSSLNAISTYWENTSPITINAIASDASSSVANLTLWYRYSSDNSTWSDNKSFGLDMSSPWNWTFDFPNGEGYYEFYSIANDTANNTETTPATADASCAYDIIPPQITDNSPVAGTTGDSYTFRAVVTDNLSLSAVHVIYWFGNGAETNATMTLTTENNYELSINIPLDSLETLHYRIVAVDKAGNWYSTEVKDVTINDNDDPEANANWTGTLWDGHIDWADYNTFAINATFNGSGSMDNIGIVNYTWNFTDNGLEFFLYGMTINHIFNWFVTHTVTLTVTDAAGNWDTDTVILPSLSASMLPSDTVDPIANAGPDQQIDAGSLVILNGSGSTDNRTVTNYTWSFTYNGSVVVLYGPSPQFRAWTPGNYTITLNVTDASGNWDSDTMVLTVEEPGELPPEGGIGDYWWIILILVAAVILGLLAFMKMKEKKPEEPSEIEEEIINEENPPLEE